MSLRKITRNDDLLENPLADIKPTKPTTTPKKDKSFIYFLILGALGAAMCGFIIYYLD